MAGGPATSGSGGSDALAWQVLAVTVLASIMVSLNTSILNVALPVVVRHYNVGSVAASWILLSYMIPTTVLLVVLGRIADGAGRGRMYLVGIVLFGGSNLLLGLAPDMPIFFILRVLEGAAGAMIMVNSVALIVAAAPPRIRTKALGLYNASFAVAQVVGPTAGAVIVHYGGWRWIFWVNVPIVVCCLIGALRVVPRTRGGSRERVPVSRAIWLSAALAMLIYSISDASSVGWSNPIVWGGLIVAAALLGVYMVSEARGKHPLVDWRFVRRSALASPLFGALAFTLAQFSLVLLVGLYYETVHGDDPISAGLRLLPLPIATALAAASVGNLTRFISAQVVAVTGLCVSAVGLLTIAITISQHTSYVYMAVMLVVIGSGGVFLPANTSVIFSRVPEMDLAVINSIRLLVQNLGLALSTALTLTFITAPVGDALRAHVLAGTLAAVSPSGLDELMSGFQYALYALCGFAGAGAIATAVWRPRSDDLST